MKTMLLSLIIALLCAPGASQITAYGGGMYAETAVVISIDFENDVVTAEGGSGAIWEFYGCDGYTEGDWVDLLMYGNGTADTIFDDVVLYAEGVFETTHAPCIPLFGLI